MYKRIHFFFRDKKQLYETQYGFRVNKNTELTNLNLIQKVLPSVEQKSFAVCVFLDYVACFDTLDRDLLLNKLESYDVKGVALNFARSSFEWRRQFVMHNSITSETVEQKIGVMQG